MTLEQLLEMDAATLKAMTDEELLAHFEPYFNVTRPERVVRQSAKAPLVSSEERAEAERGFAALESLGIKLDKNDYLKRTFGKGKK